MQLSPVRLFDIQVAYILLAPTPWAAHAATAPDTQEKSAAWATTCTQCVGIFPELASWDSDAGPSLDTVQLDPSRAVRKHFTDHNKFGVLCARGTIPGAAIKEQRHIVDAQGQNLARVQSDLNHRWKAPLFHIDDAQNRPIADAWASRRTLGVSLSDLLERSSEFARLMQSLAHLGDDPHLKF